MNKRKELTAFRMINWHNCSDSGILKLAGNTLLTGPTGSGKSSLQDALFLTITLNEYNFNKASGDNSKRDLRSYVRCRIDEKKDGKTQKYKRKGKVITYLLTEMFDANNDVYILGCCFVSPSDNADIEKHYFVIRNKCIDEVEVIGENRCPLGFKAFQSQFAVLDFHSPKTKSDAKRLFAQTLGFKKDQVELYEKLGDILAKLMSGKSNIANVDSFIKEYILKNTILDIDSMELILRDLNEMTETLGEYETRQEKLEETREKASDINGLKQQISQDDVLYVVSSYEFLKNELATIEKELEKLRKDENACVEEMEVLAKKRDYYQEQKFRLENTDDKQQLAQFNREKEQLEQRLKVCENAKRSLVLKVRQFADLLNTNRAVKTLFQTNFDWNDMELDNERFHALLDELETFQDVLLAETSKTSIAKNDLQEKYNALHSETAKLRNGLSISHIATNAVKAIDKYFEEHWIQDKAKVVCDCIDFNTNDPDWKATLESYLGNIRFFIVVKPENYQVAKEIIKNGNFYNVSVIDTTETSDKSARNGSICDLLTYSNEYVEQFLKYKYGGIMAVETCLNGVPDTKYHYLGKDGTTYGGRAFSLKNKKVQFYIGQEAKEQMIQENESLLETYKEELQKYGDTISVYSTVKDMVRRMVYEMNNTDKAIFKDLKVLPDEIEVLDENIRDLTSENSIFDAQKKIREIAERVQDCDQKQKELQENQNKVSRQIGAVEGKQRDHLDNLTSIEPQYLDYQSNEVESFEEAKAKYEEILLDKRKTIPSVCKSLEMNRQKLESKIDESNRELVKLQRNYCDLYNGSLSFSGVDSQPEFDEEYERIALNGLPELRESVQTKRTEELNLIKTNIIKYFKRSFDEAEQIVRNLNKTLRDITHGGKTYLLTTPVAAPGFETYYSLIKDTEIAGYSAEEGVKHSDEEYEEFYEFVRSNPDNTDYRNYIKCDVAVRKYDDGQLIEKRLSESLSVSSGGEKQVPLYILSAMSLLSIYVADRTNDVLRFTILDEAFSFIDASHTESVLEYFDAINLQLMIGVPDRMAKLFQNYTDNQIYVLNNAQGRTFKALTSPRKFAEFTKIE